MMIIIFSSDDQKPFLAFPIPSFAPGKLVVDPNKTVDVGKVDGTDRAFMCRIFILLVKIFCRAFQP
jgi:hypothetical protein